MYSTYRQINSMTNHKLGAPYVAVKSIDNNEDGLMEELDFEMSFHTKPEEIRNVMVMASFDYSLKKLLQIEMKGLMVLNV